MKRKDKKFSPKQAVALKYVPKEDQAPKIAAKGAGILAEKIIGLAKEHGIPIHEDPALVQILGQLDYRQEIPPFLYLVVAEILAFVYSLNRQSSVGPGEKR